MLDFLWVIHLLYFVFHLYVEYLFFLSLAFISLLSKDQLGGSGHILLKPEKESSDSGDRQAYRIESFKEHKTG